MIICYRIAWLCICITLLISSSDFFRHNLNCQQAVAGDSQAVRIEVNPIIPLDFMRREDIYRLRKAKIDKYRQLGIYPDTYQPNSSIFGSISEKSAWVKDTQFYVSNPYLLVLTSGGNYVGAYLPYCFVDHVEYTLQRIDSRCKDHQAKTWLDFAFRYADSNGIVRLWFVNARDAGFKYAHVDIAQSLNIRAASKAGNSVVDGVYSAGDFFHVGRSQKNNISTDDPRAKLQVIKQCERVMIYVKLWKNQPATVHAKEDFAYVIDVDPGDNKPLYPFDRCKESDQSN